MGTDQEPTGFHLPSAACGLKSLRCTGSGTENLMESCDNTGNLPAKHPPSLQFLLLRCIQKEPLMRILESIDIPFMLPEEEQEWFFSVENLVACAYFMVTFSEFSEILNLPHHEQCRKKNSGCEERYRWTLERARAAVISQYYEEAESNPLWSDVMFRRMVVTPVEHNGVEYVSSNYAEILPEKLEEMIECQKGLPLFVPSVQAIQGIAKNGYDISNPEIRKAERILGMLCREEAEQADPVKIIQTASRLIAMNTKMSIVIRRIQVQYGVDVTGGKGLDAMQLIQNNTPQMIFRGRTLKDTNGPKTP